MLQLLGRAFKLCGKLYLFSRPIFELSDAGKLIVEIPINSSKQGREKLSHIPFLKAIYEQQSTYNSG